MNKYTMIQTSDAGEYAQLLKIGGSVNQLYCRLFGLEYFSYVGIKRGYFPWHATFNRITILKEFIDAGYDGWVFYVDADAFIYDLNKDCRDFCEKSDSAMLMSPGGLTGEHWDVNDGVFLANLSNPIVKKIVAAWYEDFMSTSDDALKAAKDWYNVKSCQPRFHSVLKNNPEFQRAIQHVPREVLNHHDASFVRQILRSNVTSFDERVKRTRVDCRAALNKFVSSIIDNV